MKAVAAGFVSLMLLPVLVLGAFAGWGVEGGSQTAMAGDDADLIGAVLAQPTIVLTPSARGDIEAGRIDPRILGVLLAVAEEHRLDRVGPLITGHSYYVKGTTRVSNHAFGRAVDILAVEGAPVSPANESARALMQEILSLPVELLPDEVGGPWIVSSGARSSFTDSNHLDHIHVGFDA